MADVPSGDDQESRGVLRPFVDHPHEPLPPVPPLDGPPPEAVQPPVVASPPAVPDPPPAPSNPLAQPTQSPDPLLMSDDELLMFYPAEKKREIVLSRGVFGLGLSVVAVVIAGLVFLWTTADDGDSSAQGSNGAAAGPTTDSAPADSVVIDDGNEPSDTNIDVVDASIVADLEAEVAALSAEIATNPVPALPGGTMQRIIVSAEASFVSASETSVAVVGPFGNYANIDPTSNAVTAAGQVAQGATRVIRTPTSVWLTNYHDGELVWVDPVTNTVKQIFDFPGPDGLAKDGGSLVVSSFDDGFVGRFDPRVGQVIEQVDVGGSPTALVVGDQGEIWVALFDTGELVRIDPSDFTVTDRIPVGAGPVGLAISEGSVWVANNQEGTVAEVSTAERAVVSSFEVGLGPTELLVLGESVWVTVTDAGELVQIDISESKIVTRTPLGGVARNGGPTGISFGAGSIWVAIEGEQSVVRITLPA